MIILSMKYIRMNTKNSSNNFLY